MRIGLLSLLLLLPLSAQEDPMKTLADRIGSQITWISDGTVVTDKESRRKPVRPARDTIETFTEAKKKATAEKKLILWYAPRIAGGHSYRGALPDSYMQHVFFTHPDVVALVNLKFVPMYAMADAKMTKETGVGRFEVLEPAVILMTPEGRVVHYVRAFRTFNADWLIDVLRQVLQKHPEYNDVDRRASIEDLILGGDYEAALRKNPKPYESAMIARRMRQGEKALALLSKVRSVDAAVERGRVLLAMGRIEDAKVQLTRGTRKKSDRSPEAGYLLGLAQWYSAQEDAADETWKDLVKSYPASPWAWRAAGNFVKDRDTWRKGPGTHAFDDPFWAIEKAYAGPPNDTRLARDRDEVQDMARRAVEWLLRTQRDNGGWEDSRYAYWPRPEITPNVWVSATAAAAAALMEWREVDPKRIDAAVKKAEKYCLDEAKMNRGKNEEIYADSIKILYLARKAAKATDNKAVLQEIGKVAKALAVTQKENGSWAHEYDNPFATAMVVHALQEAKAAGAAVEDKMITRGADSLEATRGENGEQKYGYGRGRPSSLKDSSARIVPCDTALYRTDRLKIEDVRKAFTVFWDHADRIERVRKCDFHTDGELAGFFFFHCLFLNSEAVRQLPKEERRSHYERILTWMRDIPEFDGSFIDSHELGKSYGTAMALLTIRNCREGLKK